MSLSAAGRAALHRGLVSLVGAGLAASVCAWAALESIPWNRLDAFELVEAEPPWHPGPALLLAMGVGGAIAALVLLGFAVRNFAVAELDAAQARRAAR